MHYHLTPFKFNFQIFVTWLCIIVKDDDFKDCDDIYLLYQRENSWLLEGLCNKLDRNENYDTLMGLIFNNLLYYIFNFGEHCVFDYKNSVLMNNMMLFRDCRHVFSDISNNIFERNIFRMFHSYIPIYFWKNITLKMPD